MEFTFDHFNYHVTDMARSVAFYKRALGMKVLREIGSDDGPVHFVFMGYGDGDVVLELKYEKAHKGPYDTGDKSYHFCVKTEDMEEAIALYKEMGVLTKELPGGHGCFIQDPDGYQVEIMKKN